MKRLSVTSVLLCVVTLLAAVLAGPAAANNIPHATLTVVAPPPNFPDGHADLFVDTHHWIDDWQVHLRVKDENVLDGNGQLVASTVHSNRFYGTGVDLAVIDCTHLHSEPHYKTNVLLYAQYVFHWTRSLSDGTNIDETVRKSVFQYHQPAPY